MSERRVLTITVEVIQPEANWIWESHLKQKTPMNGCVVKSISDGSLDSIIELDRIEQTEDDEYD